MAECLDYETRMWRHAGGHDSHMAMLLGGKLSKVILWALSQLSVKLLSSAPRSSFLHGAQTSLTLVYCPELLPGFSGPCPAPAILTILDMVCNRCNRIQGSGAKATAFRP